LLVRDFTSWSMWLWLPRRTASDDAQAQTSMG
jgi:hypothetical protein